MVTGRVQVEASAATTTLGVGGYVWVGCAHLSQAEARRRRCDSWEGGGSAVAVREGPFWSPVGDLCLGEMGVLCHHRKRLTVPPLSLSPCGWVPIELFPQPSGSLTLSRQHSASFREPQV